MGDDLNFDTWENLSAYLDGELDEFAAAKVERAVHLDPELAGALDALRRQQTALHAWSRHIDSRPLPPAVRAMLEHAREQCRCGKEECRGEQHCDG